MNEAKRRFLLKDRIIKGIHKKGHFKVSVVKTTQLVEEARKRHHLSPLATIYLGKAMTATMLLASELKGEERLQLRIDANGPLQQIMVEANKNGEIRGYVAQPQASIDPTTQQLEDGLGIGLLQIEKVLYNKAKPKTSTVELKASDITTDIAYYLEQSEQISSFLNIDLDFDEDGSIRQIGGILIQMLPGAPDHVYIELQERLSSLPRIPELFADDVYIDQIMERVTGSMDVRELERYPVDFYCRCSKERFEGALALLNIDELEAMTQEAQQMVCHYCNESYVFTADEMKSLVREAKSRLN